MRKQLLFLGTIFTSLVLSSAVVSAHVVVKPAEVATGAFQTFTIGVPNEKENATIGVKLTIPSSLKYVQPTVKPGWVVDVEKEGEGETAIVKSITWSGGSVGAGFRDDFTFSAKVPDTAGDIQWKAYQTYEDGTLVSWDQSEEGNNEKESENKGPFSVTKVSTNVKASSTTTSTNSDSDNTSSNQATITAVAALIISLIALAVSTRRPSKK